MSCEKYALLIENQPRPRPHAGLGRRGLVFGSSTIDSSTCDSSVIFAFQLLIASHKQFGGVLGGRAPMRNTMFY